VNAVCQVFLAVFFDRILKGKNGVANSLASDELLMPILGEAIDNSFPEWQTWQKQKMANL